VLAALTLHWAFRGDVRLHREPQTAELGQVTHFRHFRSPRYRHNKVGGEGAGSGGFLVATTRAELQDSLDVDAQHLPYDVFGHVSA
jgi:hypothetical protein